MASNNLSSSDSDGGGAPLRSVKTTPAHKNDSTSKSDTPPDEEVNLAQASRKWVGINSPTQMTRGVAQSVAPTTYEYRSGLPFATGHSQAMTMRPPTRPGTARPGSARAPFSRPPMVRPPTRAGFENQFMGAGPSGSFARHRASVSSVNSSGQGDDDAQWLPLIDRKLKIAASMIKSSGAPMETALQLENSLREIYDMTGNAFFGITDTRDKIRETFRRTAQANDRLKSDNDHIRDQLRAASQRESILKQECRVMQDEVDMHKQEIQSLQDAADAFKQYHDNIKHQFKAEDDKHYLQLQVLKEEVKQLRQKNAELTSRVAPTTLTGMQAKDGESSVAPSGGKTKLSERDTMLLKTLQKGAGKSENNTPSRESTRTAFRPNPQAPAWAPSRADGDDHDDETAAQPRSIPAGHVLARRPKMTGLNDSGAGLRKREQQVQQAPRRRDTQTTATTTTTTTSYGSLSRTGSAINSPEVKYTRLMSPTDDNALVPAAGHQTGSIPRHKEHWDPIDIRNSITHLYDLVKGYVVNSHQQDAPRVPLSQLGQGYDETWEYLLSLIYADRKAAHSHLKFLLQEATQVPYVIQRAVTDYLFARIISPNIFLGFSAEMDDHLGALQDQIAEIAGYNDRSSSRSRQRVIQEHARLVQAIVKSEYCETFRNEVVQHHAESLADLLAPMQSKNVTRDMAVKALCIVVGVSWDMSTKIWTSGITLHYSFPDCGTKFTCGTMKAMNGAVYGQRPDELQQSQCRVSFVITPTLSVRDDRDLSNLRCLGIHKAEVLVMK
ncbi:hypothetical protein F4780DRAFT_781544 [Xylariomycetidae sp. FL0641]|nr:hypothetical protein F4780DRAFT_781544 [Xylariomycetidae sp. FL0641]